MTKFKQMSLFDITNTADTTLNAEPSNNSDDNAHVSPGFEIFGIPHYTLSNYLDDIKHFGLRATWTDICAFALSHRQLSPNFLQPTHFGELYELGLATQDKLQKKKSGQYYTPDDVARVMCEWLVRCDGSAVCDVGCGTGTLIMTYLETIGYDAARALISNGNLYLYDSDDVALKICKTSIILKYGSDIANAIHNIHCDFLDKSITLPRDCKVISNPPYAHIGETPSNRENSAVLKDTDEMYACFMEKICMQARSAVVITPFSFISGTKFSSLRAVMCNKGNGSIISFDNVPGNIFRGKKHGIFNTNTANSVRAAITIFNSDAVKKGFRVSPLIRFKNEERESVLQCDVLENTLPDRLQLSLTKNDGFAKIQ